MQRAGVGGWGGVGGGLLFVLVLQLLIAVASLVAEHKLQMHGCC